MVKAIFLLTMDKITPTRFEKNVTLYVYCDGGFANRYNSLISGLTIAECCGCIPIVVWPKNNWCGAGFHECFENQRLSVEERVLPTFEENLHDFSYVLHVNQLNWDINFTSPSHFKSTRHFSSFIKHSGKNKILFYTNSICAFLKKSDLFNTIFKLRFRAEYHSQVEKFLSANNLGQFTGLHLRGTDFTNKPNIQYYCEMVSTTPNKNYFICSDEASYENAFKHLPNAYVFPKNCYVEKLNLTRDWNFEITDDLGRIFNYNVNRSAVSVQQALIDLLLLSHADSIIQPCKSTFSTTAKNLKSAYSYKTNALYRLGVHVGFPFKS